eukprot:jgi/Ulvmu1/4153/UM019_0132.1
MKKIPFNTIYVRGWRSSECRGLRVDHLIGMLLWSIGLVSMQSCLAASMDRFSNSFVSTCPARNMQLKLCTYSSADSDGITVPQLTPHLYYYTCLSSRIILLMIGVCKHVVRSFRCAPSISDSTFDRQASTEILVCSHKPLLYCSHVSLFALTELL